MKTIQQARKDALANFRVSRWIHPNLRCHLWGIIQSCAGLFDGLVSLLSLGFLVTNAEMQVAYYRSFSHHLLNKKAK